MTAGMLVALRKWFSGRLARPAIRNSRLKPPADHTDNPHFVTDPVRIINLLRQLMAATPLCSVSLGNTNETFYTSIVDIQAENRLIIIDRLSPLYGNSALLDSNELKITGTVNGVQLSFILKVITQYLENSEEYQAILPSQVFYPQLRNSPRIATKSNSIIFQGIVKSSGRPIKGYVSEFSRAGLSINCTQLNDSLQRGDILTHCQLSLPDGPVLNVELSVRTLKKAALLGQQRQIGGYFLNLSGHDQKILDRYVSALERAQIRKLRKD